MKKLFTLITIILCCSHGFGQAGQLDQSFGKNGIVIADLGAKYDYRNDANGVFVQPDGTIYIMLSYPGGQASFTKRLSNGAIDSSYGIYGYSQSLPIFNAFAFFQADGKILVTGSRFKIGRLDKNGFIDSSFGNNGLQPGYLIGVPEARAAVVQADGKIVVAGLSDVNAPFTFAISRFNTDGSFDKSFNGNGWQTADFPIITPDPQNPDGDPVTQHISFASFVAIQPDGKILAVGGNGEGLALARFNTDGSPDATFGSNGQQAVPGVFGSPLEINNNGELVLVSWNASGFPILSQYGPLDNSGPVSQSSIGFNKASTFQQDGKFLYTSKGTNSSGTYDFVVSRTTTQGLSDNTFNNTGTVTTDINSTDDEARAVAVQSDGKILVIGSEFKFSPNHTLLHFALVRYNPDGSLDNTFDNDGKLEGGYDKGNTIFYASAIQADGRIVAAGKTWNGSNNDFAITRYNADGSPDNTFNLSGKQITDFGEEEEITSIVIQPDGKIIAAGSSSDNSSYIKIAIARYNPDGSLDNTFIGNGKYIFSLGSNFNCRKIALLNDGKILLGGSSLKLTAQGSHFSIVKLNADGTPDNSFGTIGQIIDPDDKSIATSLVVQNDGKIIIGGDLFNNSTSYNISNFSLARYNTDGSPDNTFGTGGRQTISFGVDEYRLQDIAIQTDGKIVAAGYQLQAPSPFHYSFVVARYLPGGNLDNTFGINGFQITDLGNNITEASAIAITDNGSIAVGGTNGDFAIVLYKPDGTLDNSFSVDGIQTTTVGANLGLISSLNIAGNKLYAVGRGDLPGSVGVITRYLLDNPKSSFTCPPSQTVSTEKEKCSAIINNIDPVTSAGNTSVNYTLTGATTLSGAGSASGLTFNKGVTTVTYSLVSDPSVNCSFTITVNDTEFPRISKVYALPYILWPANHKMRYVYLFFNTKDNCGATDCKISVTSNQNISGDWEVINNHLIKLRAERTGGKERIYTVMVTCTDAAGNVSSKSVRIVVPKSRGNGNDHNIKSESEPQFEYADRFNIRAYPNPSSNYFTLQVQSNNYSEKINLKVYDISGRLVEAKNGIAPGKNITIGSTLHEGVYIAEVQQGKDVQHVKLLKTANK